MVDMTSHRRCCIRLIQGLLCTTLIQNHVCLIQWSPEVAWFFCRPKNLLPSDQEEEVRCSRCALTLTNNCFTRSYTRRSSTRSMKYWDKLMNHCSDWKITKIRSHRLPNRGLMSTRSKSYSDNTAIARRSKDRLLYRRYETVWEKPHKFLYQCRKQDLNYNKCKSKTMREWWVTFLTTSPSRSR